MRPLRILHVTPYFTDAWAYGGIPRLATSLASGLARRGHQVTVCTTDACDGSARLPDAAPSRTPEGVEVRIFRNVSNALAYRLQFFVPLGLDRYLRRHAGSLRRRASSRLPKRARRDRGVSSAADGSALRARTERNGRGHRAACDGEACVRPPRRAARARRRRAGARRVVAPSECNSIASACPRDECAVCRTQSISPSSRSRRSRGSLPQRDSICPLPHRSCSFSVKQTPRKRVDVLVRAFARARTA